MLWNPLNSDMTIKSRWGRMVCPWECLRKANWRLCVNFWQDIEWFLISAQPSKLLGNIYFNPMSYGGWKIHWMLNPDDPVWLRNYSGNSKWIAWTIVKKTGPGSGDQIYQLKKSSVNIDIFLRSHSFPFLHYLALNIDAHNMHQLQTERLPSERENKQPSLCCILCS